MESLAELQTRHRKEQKDLQGRITQKKKGASKKTRKGVNDECVELERKLKEKHDQERAAVIGDVPDVEDVPDLDESVVEEPVSGANGVAEALEKTTLSETGPHSEDGQLRKRNRQKERLARRAAEQEAAVEEAEKEAANQPDPRAIERAVMLKEFKTRGLEEKLIRPDGHCLFTAVADQLSQVGISLGAEPDEDVQEYQVVRNAAARFIEAHPDDFVAFLDEPLDEYLQKIREFAEWGGHLELLALAKTYNVEICVLQNGAPQTIEPDSGTEAKKIWLAYYRHGFGLGEHYNSLRKSP